MKTKTIYFSHEKLRVYQEGLEFINQKLSMDLMMSSIFKILN